MPGLLPKNARCPKCGEPIIGMVRETSRGRIVYRYFHDKIGRRRRKPLCKVTAYTYRAA